MDPLPTWDVHLSPLAHRRLRHRNLWCPVSVAVNEPPHCFGFPPRGGEGKNKKKRQNWARLDFFVLFVVCFHGICREIGAGNSFHITFI